MHVVREVLLDHKSRSGLGTCLHVVWLCNLSVRCLFTFSTFIIMLVPYLEHKVDACDTELKC